MEDIPRYIIQEPEVAKVVDERLIYHIAQEANV